MKVFQLFSWYQNTEYFNKLSTRSKLLYRRAMDSATLAFGMYPVAGVRPRLVNEWYSRQCALGQGNNAAAVARIMVGIWNIAIRNEFATINPFSKMRLPPYIPRTVMWSKDQIELFKKTAIEEGKEYCFIAFMMAYTWCQRSGDIMNMKWGNYYPEAGYVQITQQKRKKIVTLPVDDVTCPEIKAWLDAHRAGTYPSLRVFNPYTLAEWRRDVNYIKEKAGLPKDLRLHDLRRTGITELIELGATDRQIMSVSGHSSPVSIAPYHVNTFPTAKDILEKRMTGMKKDVDVS